MRFVSLLLMIVLCFGPFNLFDESGLYWLMPLTCRLMFALRLILLLLVAKFVMGASEVQLGCFAVVYVLWQLLMRRLQGGGAAKKS